MARVEELHYMIMEEIGDELKAQLASVLARLPRAIADSLVDQCYFISDFNMGSVRPGSLYGKFEAVVFLHEEVKDMAGEGDAIIAHELAHAHLGHHHQFGKDHSLEVHRKSEQEAADLAMEWGFVGKAADWSRLSREIQ